MPTRTYQPREGVPPVPLVGVTGATVKPCYTSTAVHLSKIRNTLPKCGKSTLLYVWTMLFHTYE